jgi:hypothetical protein
LLVIQFKAGPRDSSVSMPPTRYSHPVPAPYREAVEKAIRTIGKWAEGESAPVKSMWREDEHALGNPAVLGGLAPTADPLVAIPRPRWKTAASILAGLLIAAYCALVVWVSMRPVGARALEDSPGKIVFSIAFSAIGAGVAIFGTLALASSPEFAVGKDGLRLPFTAYRREVWPWRPRDLGLFPWDQVSNCRWSSYEPGLLQIRIKGTRSSGRIGKQPPALIDYRVPEPYRSDVEKAIRAFGKWAS